MALNLPPLSRIELKERYQCWDAMYKAYGMLLDRGGEVRVCLFASGSKKNAILADAGGRKILIDPFPITHDACDRVGFVIECRDGKIGIATDLGHQTRQG